MEARARAAVARLQELTAAQEHDAAVAAAEPRRRSPWCPPLLRHPRRRSGRVAPDEAETITRTLLLAQRTADIAVAEAQADAERIRTDARSRPNPPSTRPARCRRRSSRTRASEARRSGEAERVAVENEVQSLVARREFLVGDVDQLEHFLIDQRERLRAAARQLEALCDRVPAGLGRRAVTAAVGRRHAAG